MDLMNLPFIQKTLVDLAFEFDCIELLIFFCCKILESQLIKVKL